MKKILSFALALAMSLAMFAVNVSAAVTADFSVSYEDATGAAIDQTKLKKDDLFFVKITMNNQDTLLMTDTALTWDKAVVKVIDNKGNDATETTKIAAYTTKRAKTAINDEYGEAFLSESAALYPDKGRAELTNYTTDVGTLESTDNNIIAIYRFKVIKEGDADFGLVAKVDAGDGKGLFTISADKTVVPAFVIPAGSATTKTEYFNATLTWGIKAKANTGVEFIFDGADNTAKVPFGSVSFDDETEVKVGLEVTDVPADATLTLTDVDWYE